MREKFVDIHFNQYAYNVYSQHGEDGIIEAILERLPTDNWCVEFGAWDGEYLSNTNNLIRSKGYRSVLIEADADRYQELCLNHPGDQSIKLNLFVEFEGQNTLDNALASTPIPLNFDFLSIDVDGCDYHVFDSLQTYRPKLICVEFNPTIPNEVAYVQERDFNVRRGSSALALVDLAAVKGYALLAATECNLLFLDSALLGLCGMSRGLELSECRDDREYRVFLFSGYDGALLTDRPVRLPWHEVELPLGVLQCVPRPIRAFPAEYDERQWAFYRLWVASHQPKSLRKAILKEVRILLGGLKQRLLSSLRSCLDRRP